MSTKIRSTVHNGAEILESREHVLRILFTTLEYLEFTVCEKPQFPAEKIKAAKFKYFDMI